LAFLAHVRVDPFADPALAYRKPNLWSSTVVLQLTQRDFPEGRILETQNRREALINLAPLYARLVNTDQVKRRMKQSGPVLGRISARPVVDENRSSLPLVEMSSFAFVAANAKTRVQRQAAAFMAYIAAQQAANSVNPANRVLLKVVSGPTGPVVVVPRKLTLPIVVFLSMLVVTGGLILALENLKRGGRGSARSDRSDVETHAALEALPTPQRAEPASVDDTSESVEEGKQVVAGGLRLSIPGRRGAGSGADRDGAEQGRASRHVPRG
jgi:hypothetical protein